MRAEVITIGDELLIGQVVDTNSAWIAEQLNAYGIELDKKKIVMNSPIKTEGPAEVELKLYQGIGVKLRLNVVGK